MLNKEVLKAMGFQKSDDPAWGHEVWCHNSDIWVHFQNGHETELSVGYYAHIDGEKESMEKFFELFFAQYDAYLMGRAYVSFY